MTRYGPDFTQILLVSLVERAQVLVDLPKTVTYPYITAATIRQIPGSWVNCFASIMV